MKTVNIILDTDVGSDCDDMAALAYLVYAKRYLGVNIGAITYSHTSPYGVACIRALFRSLGESVPLVGASTIIEDSRDLYCRQVCDRFATKEDMLPHIDATKLLRKALAENERSIICAIGPMTNIASLLSSEPDEICELDGASLVEKKCSRIVVMAGDFSHLCGGEKHIEWNIKCDIPAMQMLLRLSKTEVVFSPFELGKDIVTGRPEVEKYGENSALGLSFNLFGASRGRHSWDPVTLLYTVEGCGDFFCESDPCSVTVDDDGMCSVCFCGGKHKILSMKSFEDTNKIKSKCAEYIDAAIMKILEESVKI